MDTAPLGRAIGRGALAGAVAGVVGAAAMYWLVEPSIRSAIAIEEGASAPAETGGHAHDHGAELLVSRGEQVTFGLVTVVVVGMLIGIAFALAHRFLAARLPGRTSVASTMILAGLGFLAFTLAPAIVMPANPPAVGDPDTVNLRTAAYLSTIVCAVALTVLVVAVARSHHLSSGMRVVAASALGVIGTGMLLFALPHAADPVPADVPADLIWEFRIASLAQLGLMWLVLGVTLAWLNRPRTVATRPAADHLSTV